MAFLAIPDRLPSDLRYYALCGAARDAAANLYLSAGPRSRDPKPHRIDRRAHTGRRRTHISNQCYTLAPLRRSGRQRSLGRVDAGMVHYVATARIQFRRAPEGPKPPPSMGLEAPGRPGLEVRMNQRMC